MMKGRVLRDGVQHSGDDRLAGGHAEGAAEKFEVLHRNRRIDALDLAGADFHRIRRAGLQPVSFRRST